VKIRAIRGKLIIKIIYIIMSVNKNALIRYKTIDACLQNRFRKWTLENLVEKCSEALYEYEGIQKGVSLRTIQMDIQMMRSEKLGYNAPIIVLDKKFYTYEDAKYSITKIPLTHQDLNILSEVVKILQQFKGFNHFQAVESMVGRLQHQIHRVKNKQANVIHFETNEHLVGLQYLDGLYQAILEQKTLEIEYQSFKASNPKKIIFFPHILKEFRNRWFLLGTVQHHPYSMLIALDRIKKIHITTVPFQQDKSLTYDYFDNMIGVSKTHGQRAQKVSFWVNREHTPYVQTKPLHKTQRVEHDLGVAGCIFAINVIINYELEREVLGFGEAMHVITPASLRERIRKRHQYAVDNNHFDFDFEGVG
jgi:predicted DNA-binding transcriptional regulator YafY